MRVRGLGQLKLVTKRCERHGIGSDSVVIGIYHHSWNNTDLDIVLYLQKGFNRDVLERLSENAVYRNFRDENAPSTLLRWARVFTKGQELQLHCILQCRGFPEDVEGCLKAAARILSRAHQKALIQTKSSLPLKCIDGVSLCEPTGGPECMYCGG
jgi:hypothetical protein